MKVIVVGDAGRTGVRIAEYTGTAPLLDPGSTMTISFGVFSDSSARQTKDQKEEDAKAKECERERVRKMREGWKEIRKGHQFRR